MANKTLKGLTIKIGGDTTELYKSLNKVDDQTNKLSRELGQINKLLNLDPTNTELLAQKQKVLADAISSTKDKLGTLREAEKQVQEQFERGEASEEQVRALRREIIQTEDKLTRYKNAAKEAAEAAEKLANGSDEAAHSMDNQADKTDEAKRATSDLDDAAGDLAKDGLTVMVTAATAALTTIVALAESSRQYRSEINKLNTAYAESNHSGEAATKTYEDLQSILGETDRAVEAASHLAKLCDNEEDLSAMTEALTGVYATFGASLPIEGLAEAANETAKVGRVTGNFADAINWASDESTNWGAIIGGNSKAMKGFNKAIKDGEATEDAYTAALEACSSEQERQQLIQKTLTSLYGSAAATYKQTNAEVIRANQATERWNKTAAKIGKTVDPVVTDIKELGTTILEDASEPLEDAAELVRKKLLPQLKNVSGWVKSNGPAIKATLVGVTAAVVAHKVASVATTVAHTGLKGAIMATTVAQKALALAQAATPWGLAATAIVGLTAAMSAYIIANREAQKPVDVLTTEERELMAAVNDTAQAFREQRQATNDALGDVTAEMDHTQKLADELRSLADASGRVKDTDKERVQFILNELNKALGTEYEMTGNVIKNYKDLDESINDVIASKKANALLEAYNDQYVQAIQNEAEALQNLNLHEKDYQHQLAITQQKEDEYLAAKELLTTALASCDQDAIDSANIRLQQAQGHWEDEKAILAEKKTAYDEAAINYGTHYNTIATFEEAQTAILSGNYDKAVDLLARKGGAYSAFAETVDEETAKVLDDLYKEAIDAGLEAERTKENFENGVAGYTEGMVQEADENYHEAMRKFETAYADAQGVGEDVSDGFGVGMTNKRGSLFKKARDLVSGVINAMRKEADSHSPSRKTIAFGEDVGEGPVIGIQRKTKDAKKAATEQVSAIMEAYQAPDIKMQHTFRNISDRQADRYVGSQMTAATANSAVLEQILATIKAGQVLVLDSNVVAGGTAGKVNSILGANCILTERGAL